MKSGQMRLMALSRSRSPPSEYTPTDNYRSNVPATRPQRAVIALDCWQAYLPTMGPVHIHTHNIQSISRTASRKQPTCPGFRAISRMASRKQPTCPGFRAISRTASRKHPTRPGFRAISRTASRKHPTRPEFRAISRMASRKQPSRPGFRAISRMASRK